MLMWRHGSARGVALAVLVAVTVATVFVVFGTHPNAIADYYYDTLTPSGFAVWVFGLIAATLAPPILAITFWFGSKRSRFGWLLHFLLLPTSYAVVRGAIAAMLIVAGEPDSDSLTGWATDPAVMLMLLCPLVYFAALGFAKLRGRSARANGS
jgi:phosphoglycerol transferase MdoB-like AlkP superfamily enzyme